MTWHTARASSGSCGRTSNTIHTVKQPPARRDTGFQPRRWLPARAEKTQAMLRRLRELQHFPGETLILSVEGINARFARKFGGVPGARII